MLRWLAKRDVGSTGERLAADHLKQQGYRILKRNYRCPVGEIDIVARDDAAIVFVEVKSRRSDVLADPEINVTWAKRKKLIQCAKYFMQCHATNDAAARFDVVSVVVPNKGTPRIEHFVDAFDLSAK